jgi:hypothetical protein
LRFASAAEGQTFGGSVGGSTETMSGIGKAAKTAGAHGAKRLFAARGNPLEVHLNETDLALFGSLLFQAGFEVGVRAIQKVREDTNREIEDESSDV